MGPMGLNPPNIYVTSILVRSVQVLCTIGVITADRVAKKAKNEGKLPFYGYFLAIWVGLWRRDSNHSNIYWHPWFGPILSTFGCLEVSFAENSHLSLTRCFRGTSSFHSIKRGVIVTFYIFHSNREPKKAFYCCEMCKKSKSPPFLYYKICWSCMIIVDHAMINCWS